MAVMTSSSSAMQSAFKALGLLRVTMPTRPSVPPVDTLTCSSEGREDMGREKDERLTQLDDEGKDREAKVIRARHDSNEVAMVKFRHWPEWSQSHCTAWSLF